MSVTDSTNPGETIVDILKHCDTQFWTENKPEILQLHERSPKGRENATDDAIYVNGVEAINLERFSADPVTQNQDASVRVLVYSLSESRVLNHTEDILECLRDYMNDNYEKTAWHNIEPSDVIDHRDTRVYRRTEHYVFEINADLHRQN